MRQISTGAEKHCGGNLRRVNGRALIPRAAPRSSRVCIGRASINGSQSTLPSRGAAMRRSACPACPMRADRKRRPSI